MQHLDVSGAVRHIYIYVVRQLRVNYCGISTLPSHLSAFQNLFLHSSSAHFQPLYARLTGVIIITDVRLTILRLSAPFCAALISPYTVTAHLYQLAVNFREGNVTPINTKSPYKLLHSTKYPNSLQLFIILSTEHHLTDWLWHHLLHVAPTTSATFYQKKIMLD